MERKERWFHVYIILVVTGVLLALGERSFFIWLLISFSGFLVYANTKIDELDDKIEHEIVEQIRLGRAPALKYEATALLQHYEEILQYQPYDMKARM